MGYIPDQSERAIYNVISRSNGIKAREIAAKLGVDHKTVNHALYTAPLMKELCYQDRDYRWHGLIRQTRPHYGLQEFSGWYGRVSEFLTLEEDSWMTVLQEGCDRIGRNLNDTRGLLHSFRDCRQQMRGLFEDLAIFMNGSGFADWELVFELRIKKSRYIRIYTDVLVITERHVFSLEFKMKDQIEAEEVAQAGKYCPYLELVFGPDYEVVPVLVLTRAVDLLRRCRIPGQEGELPVCSADMLFNVFDEYLNLIPDSHRG